MRHGLRLVDRLIGGVEVREDRVDRPAHAQHREEHDAQRGGQDALPGPGLASVCPDPIAFRSLQRKREGNRASQPGEPENLLELCRDLL